MQILRTFITIVFIGVLTTPIFTVHAVEYGGIGGRPAYPDPTNPRTQSIFVHTLEPGVVKPDGITVINNTQESKTMMIYATDSTPSTDGAFACKQMSEEKLTVGSWITLETSEITLQPMSSQIIPFTISIPEVVDTGEHNGCILIQEKKEKIAGTAGASLSIRTGLRVAVTVPGEIIRKLALVDFAVIDQEGKITLSPQVKNTGNVSIDANVQVVTKNIFGGLFQQHGGSYPVLRGQTSDWNFELKKSFWGGVYKTQAIVEYDENPATQIGNALSETKTTLTSESKTIIQMPSKNGLMIEIGFLIIIAAIIILIVIQKKKIKNIKKTWVPYTVQPGDTINDLATTCHIDWKLLVKVNAIQPPYVLTPHTIINIPPGINIHNQSTENNEPPAKKKVVRKKRLV